MHTNPAGWLTPAAPPALTADEVQVWKVSLLGDGRVGPLRPLLDEGERARADRFAFDHLRRRFTITHGAARLILGGIVGRDPATLRFEAGPFGKPALADGGNVTFSLSHSGEMALLAVARGRRVGVDIEQADRRTPEDKFVERFFSPGEIERYLGLPAGLRAEAFFNGWTRKEAFIKALGEGLSRPLDSFDVSLAPGEPPALLHVAGAPDEPARWLMRAFDAGPDYVAALVAEGRDWELRQWTWPIEWENI